MDRITTVTSAASTYDLVTLAVVKAELGIPTLTTADDAILSLYISSESAKVAALCNRVIPKETVVDTFHFDMRFTRYNVAALQLSRDPIVSITSVYIDDTLILSDEYEFDAPSGLLYHLTEDGNRNYWFGEKIAVTYVAGYNTIPAALADACLQMVKIRNFSRSKDPTLRVLQIDGVSREEFWVGAVNEGVPSDVELLIAPYRRYGLT